MERDRAGAHKHPDQHRVVLMKSFHPHPLSYGLITALIDWDVAQRRIDLTRLSRRYPEVVHVAAEVFAPYKGALYNQDLVYRFCDDLHRALWKFRKQFSRCAALPWCGWYVDSGLYCLACRGLE